MTTMTAPVLAENLVNSIPTEARTKCEVWTRVMGYYRPISQFNIGKKQEAKERVQFSEAKSLAHGGEDDGCCGDCGGCSCGE